MHRLAHQVQQFPAPLEVQLQSADHPVQEGVFDPLQHLVDGRRAAHERLELADGLELAGLETDAALLENLSQVRERVARLFADFSAREEQALVGLEQPVQVCGPYSAQPQVAVVLRKCRGRRRIVSELLAVWLAPPSARDRISRESRTRGASCSSEALICAFLATCSRTQLTSSRNSTSALTSR